MLETGVECPEQIHEVLVMRVAEYPVELPLALADLLKPCGFDALQIGVQFAGERGERRHGCPHSGRVEEERDAAGGRHRVKRTTAGDDPLLPWCSSRSRERALRGPFARLLERRPRRGRLAGMRPLAVDVHNFRLPPVPALRHAPPRENDGRARG